MNYVYLYLVMCLFASCVLEVSDNQGNKLEAIPKFLFLAALIPALIINFIIRLIGWIFLAALYIMGS